MKRLSFIITLALLTTIISAQQRITGIILDEFGEPLAYANIFLQETLEGASSDDKGLYSFLSDARGHVTLSARMLGYENWSQTRDITTFKEDTIRMKSTNHELGDVEIIASNFVLKGSSQWKDMGAVDLVTTGGSNGDLYSSIATMPGTQVAGENGRLFIRGGESREAQTYIDDMHVLSPYTTTGSEETPVRGRYSPFMFEGMTFSLGGYDPEYGQGLSSILPLSTKDESLITKAGVSITTVGVSGGGTQSFEEGSASLNLDYQNLKPYYSAVPNRTDWISPYQKFSGGTQLRYNPSSKTVAKLYGGYDYTTLGIHKDAREMHLHESNYYLNSTFRHQTYNDYKLFTGAAFSMLNQNIKGASQSDDTYKNKEWELHLKFKADKRYSSLFKWQFGAETMLRGLHESYTFGDTQEGSLNHSINSLFTTGTFNLTENLSASFSSRLEYTSANKQWNYLPRLALNYNKNNFLISAITGRYSQLADNKNLLSNHTLSAENCWHYILGGYHQSDGKIYRVELYNKQYDKLALNINGALNATGYGYSRGIDLFFNDNISIPNFEYRVSYSINFAKRKYENYPVADIPQFATKHNATVSLRYDWKTLKSIIGITNRFASGRPYHDPNESGFMNKRAPHYNSLDLSWTFLANKKLIIYASATNILGRKQVYNYTFSDAPAANGRYVGTPVRGNADNFFFVGVFITLGGNTAYDVSNF